MKISPVLLPVVSLTLAGVSIAVCPRPNEPATEDLAVAAMFTYNEGVRDDFSNYFQLREQHWDEGWGFSSMDLRRAYRQTVNGLRLLYAVEPGMRVIERKALVKPSSMQEQLDLSGKAAPSSPEVVIRSNSQAHIFVRDGDDQLVHIKYDPTAYHHIYARLPKLDPDVIRNVSTIATLPGGAPARFDGDPIVVSPAGSSPRVLGCSKPGRPGRILLFHGEPNWQVTALNPEPVATDDSLLIYNPAVDYNLDEVFVVGADSFGVLAYYEWHKSGTITRELVPFTELEWQVSTDPGAVVAEWIGLRFEVFAKSAVGDRLLRFTRYTDVWHAEDVTESLSSAPEWARLGEGTNIAFLGTKARYSVYVRNRHGEIVHYARRRLTSDSQGAPDEEPEWTDWAATNVTQTAEHSWMPPVGLPDDLLITTGPVAVFDGVLDDRVYGLTEWGHVVECRYAPPSGYEQRNITKHTESNIPLSRRVIGELPSVLSIMHAIDGPRPIDSEYESIYLSGTNPQGELVLFQTQGSTWSITTISTEEENTPIPLRGTQAIVPFLPVNEHFGSFFVVAARQDNKSLLQVSNQAAWTWHGSPAYAEYCAGSVQDYHYKPEDANNAVASADADVFGHDQIHLACPMFKSTLFDGPAFRAGIIVHEATHMYYRSWLDEGAGHPIFGGGDPWYYHAPRGNPKLDQQHSAYQLGIEYFADLAEFADPNVPWATRANAQYWANKELNENIDPDDDPGWRVGEPRPY